MHGRTGWGTVLDAGTGEHSLSWVTSLASCTGWTAVTGSEKRAISLRSHFADKMKNNDEVIYGNWVDQNLLKGRVFDVVIADYLLGAIDGFAPYFQYKLFDRLKPLVGKHFYLVGMEPLPDATNTPHEKLIVEIAKLRDACILLAGHRCYREYPLEWTLKHLTNSGFTIENVANFETVHTADFVEAQLDVAASKLTFIQDYALKQTMSAHIDRLRNKIHSMRWSIRFGADYVITASPHK